MIKIFVTTAALVLGFTPHARANDYASGANPWLAKELTHEALLPSVHAAADFLARNQLADGQFDYIKDPLGKCCVKKKEKYSLVRHLGGAFALLRAYELTHDAKHLEAAKAAIDFALRFREDFGTFRVVKDLKGGVGLGENGFMLMVTALYDKLAGQKDLRPVSEDLARFLLRALVYDGPYATTGQWAECQAIIGLVRYYENVNPDPEVITVASTWLTKMMEAKQGSHWSVQAISAVRQIAPELDHKILAYGVSTAEHLLDGVETGATSDDVPRKVGGRAKGFGSCGVTARNEGLLAGYQLARTVGFRDRASALLDRVKEHIAHSLQFQYGTPGNFYENAPEMARMGKLFDMNGAVFDNPTSGYVRVDFVSHHVRAIATFLGLPNTPEVAQGLRFDEISMQ